MDTLTSVAEKVAQIEAGEWDGTTLEFADSQDVFADKVVVIDSIEGKAAAWSVSSIDGKAIVNPFNVRDVLTVTSSP